MCVTWPCTLRALITRVTGWTILCGKTFFRSIDPDCDIPEASVPVVNTAVDTMPREYPVNIRDTLPRWISVIV